MTRPFLQRVLSLLALMAGALLIAMAPAHAQEEDIPDVSVFYDELDEVGHWVEHPEWGYVWTPDEADEDWRPYTLGSWTYTDDYGWYWASDEPWGWAVYHYGRWGWDSEIGWFWVPGKRWGPAWVVWRSSEDYLGWAPLPPGSRWEHGRLIYSTDIYDEPRFYLRWNFVSPRYITAPGLHHYVRPWRLNRHIIGRTRPSTDYGIVDHRIINRGIPVREIERWTHRRIPSVRIIVGADPRWRERRRRTGAFIEIYRPPFSHWEARRGGDWERRKGAPPPKFWRFDQIHRGDDDKRRRKWGEPERRHRDEGHPDWRRREDDRRDGDRKEERFERHRQHTPDEADRLKQPQIAPPRALAPPPGEPRSVPDRSKRDDRRDGGRRDSDRFKDQRNGHTDRDKPIDKDQRSGPTAPTLPLGQPPVKSQKVEPPPSAAEPKAPAGQPKAPVILNAPSKGQPDEKGEGPRPGRRGPPGSVAPQQGQDPRKFGPGGPGQDQHQGRGEQKEGRKGDHKKDDRDARGKDRKKTDQDKPGETQPPR